MSGSGVRPPAGTLIDPTSDLERPSAVVNQSDVLAPALDEGIAAAASDQVILSERADIAEQIMMGAKESEDGTVDPVIASLAAQVGDGSYHPPAISIARAILTFEGRVKKAGVRG